ncbi:hypothetical protein COT94_04200 [Candidatus Falkowbacteria bacterium CG10_big_fil_rev_8_21_14_0_10_37_14]|uniref:O-antigen ligase domain-containing protein n=1 Tax=Candidatus Falkowbacteria bacterium CG10_big_fil_rev_8_21_14_0_10_37_14 TaxID=1974561 RepID=A0A2M6WSH0_9BACT|nr:hypothetical protein [Candidatus Falkowbacteria bacterium]PIT95760.1 MAG: hypothetical protein COT94_04200 [Candidatus Falkowbacteria bacterium CG10_big_fil_rev_8_21_14_0_10_37_14]
MHLLNNKTFWLTIAGTQSLYWLSLLGYLNPTVNHIWFIILTGSVLMFSVANLRWGLNILLLEMVINSKGYLFFIPIGDFNLSLRITLWSVIILVFFSQFLKSGLLQKIQAQYKKPLTKPLLVLAIAIIFGLLAGILNHNNWSNIFFDANGWLYWLLILPWLFFYSKEDFKKLWPALAGALTTLALGSLATLYTFSHNFLDSNSIFYGWLRDNGLGEITMMSGNFYRVFFQAHIWFLPAIFTIWLYWMLKIKQNNWHNWLTTSGLAALWLAPILTGLSRSYWVGLFIGWVLIGLLAIYKKIPGKRWLMGQLWLVSVGALAFLMILITVKFPWPTSQVGFSTDILTDRTEITSEAGAASRWALWPKLWQSISTKPFGAGFGTTVTYKSSDPRVLDKDPSGSYTTFSFEWGWLDIWLKTGPLGFIAYLWLLILTTYLAWNKNDWLTWSLVIGFLVIAAVNFFSPYFNHPLGIAYFILLITYLNNSSE